MNELAVFSERHKEILAGARAARAGGGWQADTEGERGKEEAGVPGRALVRPSLPTALKSRMRLLDALQPLLVRGELSDFQATLSKPAMVTGTRTASTWRGRG